MNQKHRNFRSTPTRDTRIFLPHSSWTHLPQATPPTGGIVAPDEFWARLGL